MRLNAFLLAVLAVATQVASAYAQQPALDPARVELMACFSVCFRENEQCLAKPDAKEPFCNTNQVECVTSCGSCIGVFTACVKDADQTGKSCATPFIACLKEKLEARRPNERPQITFGNGDGLSQETAVVIDGARGEFEGVSAENLWIMKHHPGWRKRNQALIHAGEKALDKIGYEATDGAHTIWYDITSFFGKLK